MYRITIHIVLSRLSQSLIQEGKHFHVFANSVIPNRHRTVICILCIIDFGKIRLDIIQISLDLNTGFGKEAGWNFLTKHPDPVAYPGYHKVVEPSEDILFALGYVEKIVFEEIIYRAKPIELSKLQIWILRPR